MCCNSWGCKESDTTEQLNSTECYIYFLGTSLIAQLVKNLPAMQETSVQFLGQEDLLEK